MECQRRHSCLICCQSLHSPLIPATGQGQFLELAKMFNVFCEYVKLDPDSSVQDEYRGKLFPFCASCSIQVYKLVEFHQEKISILQALSQMVASMAALVLESHSEDQKYLNSRSVITPEDEKLIRQIESLRKVVIENYSPRVAFDTIPPAELSRLARNNDRTFNNGPRRNIRAQSPDICQELKTSMSSDEENDFGGASMDVDFRFEAGDSDNSPGDEDVKPIILPRKRGRPKSNNPGSRRTKRNKDFIRSPSTMLQSNFPPIPEQPLEDFKIEANKYVLGNKYFFEKDTKMNVFRCSCCEYFSILWSAMYNHIFKMHYRAELTCDSSEKKILVPTRPKGEIVKLGENEYEYLGVKYRVLPHGTHKCDLCGVLRSNLTQLRPHIQSHADALPEVPDKSPEDCEIATNLFCLSRKYIFEKTGDNSFTCSHGECYQVRSTWEEMYSHVRTDHWSEDHTSIPELRLGSARTVSSILKGRSKVKKKKSNLECQIPANDDDNNSQDFSLSGSGVPPNADTSSASSENIPLLDQPSESSNGGGESSAGQLELNKAPKKKIKRRYRLKKKSQVSRAQNGSSLKAGVSELEQSRLADLETSPGQYSFRGFEFGLRDQVLHCGFCSYGCTVRTSMLKHINQKHVNDCDGFVELRPNEFLYLQQHPGTKEPDGRFRCHVDGCEFLTSFPLLSLLKAHLVQNHCEAESPTTVASPAEEETVILDSLLEKQLEKLKLKLSKYESGPGQYKYRGSGFHVAEDDQFQCDSCPFCCSRDTEKIFSHIRYKHVDPSKKRRIPHKDQLRAVQVGPNELLIADRFRAFALPDGKFKCGVEGCKTVRKRKGSLLCHIRFSHMETQNSVVCEICDRVYQNRSSLGVHMSRFHTEAERQGGPSQHKRIVTKQKMTVQEVRPGEFLFDGRFTAFRLPDKSFKCGVGDCKAVRKASITTHMHLSHMETPIVCEICGRIYQNSATLKIHMANVHAEAEKQICPTCHKSFFTLYSFQIHLKGAHKKKEKTFICDQCGKAYVNVGSLQDHIKVVHLEIVPSLPCPQCGKVYQTTAGLSAHIKTDHANAGKKLHPCPVCQKEFKYKETIRRHILVVHEGKKSSEVYKRSKRISASGRTRRPRKVKVPESDSSEESEGEEDETEEQKSTNFSHFLND